MERQFDEQLKELREYLLAMGSLAETMIVKSVKALVDRSEALVQEVFAHEEEMDQRCIESDLERIGDLAVNIAHATTFIISQPLLKPLIDIPRMAQLCQEMVKRSLDAFVARDAELAMILIEADASIDLLRDQVFRELLTYMMTDPTTIPRALDLILVSRHLERIADHAT